MDVDIASPPGPAIILNKIALEPASHLAPKPRNPNQLIFLFPILPLPLPSAPIPQLNPILSLTIPTQIIGIGIPLGEMPALGRHLGNLFGDSVVED